MAADLPRCTNCDREAPADRKLCWTCQKRLTRKRPLSRPVRPYGMSRFERLKDAARRLADADFEERREQRKAETLLRVAALRYANRRR